MIRCGLRLTDFIISFIVNSLASEQSYDCSSASKATLKDMIIKYYEGANN